jgi:hypothetical protein
MEFDTIQLRGVQTADRFSIMLLAGGEAERLHFTGLPEGRDEDDLEQAIQTLIRTRGGGRAFVKRHGGNLNARRFLTKRIERLQRPTWRLVRDPVVLFRIHRARDALLKHGTLTGAELHGLRGRMIKPGRP